METVMEDQEDEFAGAEEVLDISQLCRACASPNEYLIPIFHGEGLQYDLKHKVSRLPLQIKETDKLPVQLCYQCASTLIAFSDLVEGCAEADAKLKSLLPEGSSDPTTSLDDQTGLQSDEKSLGLQSSAASSIVETSQKVSPELNAEGVAEQDVSSMDQEDIAIEPMQQRFLDSFSVYMQTQVALKRLQWTLSGALYCLYCGQFKRNFPEFMEHLMILHKYHCDHCQARFIDEAQHTAHTAMHASDASEHTVTVANMPVRKSKRKISQPVQLIAVPKKLQISSDRQRFKCDLCPLVYLRQCYLDQHKLQFHSKVKKNPLQAQLIDDFKSEEIKWTRSKVDRKTEYNDVIFNVDVNYSDDSDGDRDVSTGNDSDSDEWKPPDVSVQSTEKEFPCSDCDYVGSTRRDMLSHKNKEHKQIGTRTQRIRVNQAILEAGKKVIDNVTFYECSSCGKNVRNPYDFLRHLKTHTDEMPFTCHQCGKRFRAMHNLTRHLNAVHEKIKRHECDICGFKFAERKACMDHRRLHTGEKPFVCEVCGKAFATHTSIYCHRRIHTDYRPHKCATCDRSFRTRQRLNDHVRIHTGVKPYSCHLCFKSFRMRSEQKRHVQTHNTDKPYGCMECGASFTLKRYLKQHMRKHPYMTLDSIDSHINSMPTVQVSSQVEEATLYIL